ncbi:MAG: YihY/virulence factor BrkB family protein [Leptolyngbyaceae cyanobacterium SM1_1_3]|nr:YihY/virulence factor BrkB family protein [Leptolyngbyaceae cyanobacterium SM1_1_3]NJN02575.1 YihY/virulence factor BrkB family protein [Leptolyngbyaceae cyanobacterium RM1_1_2]NJO08590.1 YihY/virulence factor BrkB family protein [Leptolyngbyaceae cyanobacterium SL_1_1]
MSLKRLWRLIKEAFKEWQADDASRLAAALAYYTVFSLAPLLILVIAIAGIVFDASAAKDQIVAQIQRLVGSEGASVIEMALQNANRPGSNSGLVATLISLGVLLFGASGVFVELQASLNQVWNVKAKPTEGLMNMLRKRFLSFAMILVIGFLLLVSLVLSAALAALSNFLNGWIANLGWLWQLVNLVLSVGVTTLLFAMIFKYLPDVKVTWKDVAVGALITAVLFTLGKFLIGLYLGNSSFGSTYGAAGSVVILLAWVYYSAQIMFFGAEFTQVYASRYGSRIVPDEHAVSY